MRILSIDSAEGKSQSHTSWSVLLPVAQWEDIVEEIPEDEDLWGAGGTCEAFASSSLQLAVGIQLALGV